MADIDTLNATEDTEMIQNTGSTTTDTKNTENSNSNDNSNTKSSNNEKEDEKESPSPRMMRVHVKHTLVVNGTNAICPIEVVLTATDTTGDLIPKSYDPELFFATKKSKSKHGSPPQLQAFTHPAAGVVPLPFQNQNNGNVNGQQQNLYGSNNNGNNGNDNGAPPKKKRRKSRKKHSYVEDDGDDDDAYRITDDFASYTNSGNNNGEKHGTRTSLRIKTKQARQAQYAQQYAAAQEEQARLQEEQAAIQAEKKRKKQAKAAQVPQVTFQWVQCEECMKWRRIPTTVDPSELEGKWICSMNRWDPDHQSCEMPEEDWNEAEEQTIEVGQQGDNQDYLEEQKKFYEEIDDFYQSDEMLYKQLAISDLDEIQIGGKKLDFYQLYLEVTKRGGYDNVCSNHEWENIFKCLECYSGSMVASGIMFLQEKYYDFLLDYERHTGVANINNNQNDSIVDDDSVANASLREGSNDGFRKSDVI